MVFKKKSLLKNFMVFTKFLPKWLSIDDSITLGGYKSELNEQIHIPNFFDE